MALVDLVNRETKTGHYIEMVIWGDVTITDPNIETRTMKEYVPLLCSYANPADLKKIVRFFKKHSPEGPFEGDE